MNNQGHIEVYWIMKGAGLMDTISSSVFESLIAYINTNISKELIQENTSIQRIFCSFTNTTIGNHVF